MEEKIDVVVPYVDSSDVEWQKLFNQYNPNKNVSIEAINAKNRFRGQGDFFKYFFRCIDANLPWINTIHLLVQSESQIPSWLDRSKVKVVLHKQFIPKEYLPTFNSCTIEMFLWNIPELSEKFIYFNDDMFVLTEHKVNDIFDGDKVKFKWISKPNSLNNLMYLRQCINSYRAVTPDWQNKNTYIKVDHEFRPYLKSEMIRCFTSHRTTILNSISQFREDKNINCYIWGVDLINKGKADYINTMCKTISVNTSNLKIQNLLEINNVVCINDTTDTTNIYDNLILNSWFHKHFPNCSKYELGFKENYKNSGRTKNKVILSKDGSYSIVYRKTLLNKEANFNGLPDKYWENNF